MFTGIVDRTAAVSELQRQERQLQVRIATGYTDLALGESVAVNGVCLTVVEADDSGNALFYVSPETVDCTGFAQLVNGTRVNLERALRMGDRLSGHWVQGHIDCTATVRGLATVGDAHELTLDFADPALLRYVVAKGSITVDGVSLTVNAVAENHLSIMLIPHTFTHTTFHWRKSGDLVNIEFDILAKYLERQCLKP